MKGVPLAGTSLPSSALGFGCSALMGDKTEAESLRILETAFDCGIRYFDVARMYGYGEAERLLGRFAKGKREQLTLATKFGIEPLAPAARFTALRSIARKLMRVSPRLRSAVGAGARAMMSKARFTREAAQRSLETSLRMLQTEWIDVFLLHECSSEDAASAEVLEYLLLAVEQGKIRTFGIGTSVAEAQLICRQNPQIARVAQFPNSVLVRSLEVVRPPAAAVTHGALAGSYTALMKYLSGQPALARQWSGQVGADCSDARVIAGLMLSYAVSANGSGPVLFSSSAPARIRDNVRTLEESAFQPEQIRNFAELARQSGLAPA